MVLHAWYHVLVFVSASHPFIAPKRSALSLWVICVVIHSIAYRSSAVSVRMLHDLSGISSLRAVYLFRASNDRVHVITCVCRAEILSNFGDRGLVRRIDKPQRNWQTRAYLPRFPWQNPSRDFVRHAYMHVHMFAYVRRCVRVRMYCANTGARAGAI